MSHARLTFITVLLVLFNFLNLGIASASGESCRPSQSAGTPQTPADSLARFAQEYAEIREKHGRAKTSFFQNEYSEALRLFKELDKSGRVLEAKCYIGIILVKHAQGKIS